MSKNLGVLTAPPRPTDYIAGVSSPIQISRSVKDWSPYLPTKECQRNKVTDFLDCVTMSGPDHSLTTQLNYFLSTNQLYDEALYFFHNNNYIVNGVFSLSSRFSAKMNGTDKTNGQYLNVAADCVRRDGLVPELLWPTKEDMTWEEFYKIPDQRIIDLAKKFLWFIDVKYQWVKKEDFNEKLAISPIQAATEVCAGWDSGQTVQKCSGQPLQHATMVYGQNNEGEWMDFDQYPPYTQNLAQDYEFPYNLQYVLTVKPTTLRNGMYGSNVLQLQKDLNKLGFLVKEDSDFGPKTQTQVISFQNKTGLKADGIAGPLTLKKLKDLIETPSIEEIITEVCKENNIPPDLGIAVAKCEGGITNPRITRKNTDGSIDRGIFQFNSRWFSYITDDVAFDPKLATATFCRIVKTGGLHSAWHLSEPNWKKLLSVETLKEYNIK